MVILGALVVGVAGGAGDWLAVADHFRAGEYAEAGSALAVAGDRSTQALYWDWRLEREPDQALSLIDALRRESNLPAGTRIQLALEEAEIHFGRGHFQAALAGLEELIEAEERVPGRVHLLAGLCNWSLQRVQRSREAFATIRKTDPAFALARYYLGRIGLENGDTALALRYFASAEKGELADRLLALQVCTWEGLRQSGRLDEAATLGSRLLAQHPRCLDVIPLQAAAVADTSMAPGVPPGPVVDSSGEEALPAAPRGRVSLQLGAFADRGRALVLLDAWQDLLPGIRLEEELEPIGHLLYKVRTGHFISRSQARTEAKRLARVHGLDVLVVEIDE